MAGADLRYRTAVYERAHTLVESMDRKNRPLALLNAALLEVETLIVAERTDAAIAALLPLIEQCARHRLVRPVLDAGPAVTLASKNLRQHLRRRADLTVSAVADEYLANLEKLPI
ncbi:hypothetical protein [Rhodococcus rhodochrous]|uniref:Uncharacterized protein n=1 Tax=Rhodococcus rhodochrous TaxID=1829 RepID=A0AA46X1B5_RHORH|nr:hypothetical protein [Rhodococcus rhodochrous]UZF48240.1 hypothetical protein KUM34_028215 [Rhodococcus rhodochrous]